MSEPQRMLPVTLQCIAVDRITATPKSADAPLSVVLAPALFGFRCALGKQAAFGGLIAEE